MDYIVRIRSEKSVKCYDNLELALGGRYEYV